MLALKRFRYFLVLLVALSVASFVAIARFYPPDVTLNWLYAFATLLLLAIVSALLALRISEGGTTTAVDFIPQLASIILLGPFGAVALTIIEQLFTEFLVLKKAAYKALFNLAQVALATATAAVLYLVFGGEVAVNDLNLRVSLPPFLLAVLAYFSVNSLSVFYVVALRDGRPFFEVWRESAGSILVFDFAMSPLAYAVAYLYVQWGPVALLAAIIPMIGLRYSYGVNIELQQLNQDLLRVLIKTLEARDRYTSGHSIRVAERSRRIAKTLNLRSRAIRLIETAALLHDIGKIDLAYGEILRQKGPLTPEQRELIRAHPDKGVEIIGSVRALDPLVLRCVRHHHEWFDGSGYPAGIAGEEIPLGARIIMMSDSIDAMLTDRPYRKALSIDQVRQEILRNSGTQFDPLVVEATIASGVLDIHLPDQDRDIFPGHGKALAT